MPGPYSIWRLVRLLHDHGLYMLVVLVVSFSLCFPPIKLCLVTLATTERLSMSGRRQLLEVLGVLGRWSLLDVMLSLLFVMIFADQQVDGVIFVAASVRRGLPAFTASILCSMSAAAILHHADEVCLDEAGRDDELQRLHHVRCADEEVEEDNGLAPALGCAVHQGSGAWWAMSYWHGVSCTMAIAALVSMVLLWDTSLIEVDMRPLAPHAWSLHTALAHTLADSRVMGLTACLLLFAIPGLTMGLALMAPWSAKAHRVALRLSDACCLDVFLLAVLIYRFEERHLVTLKWQPQGIAYLFAAAALVASTACVLRSAPLVFSRRARKCN
jgi:uncharacterized paraquat-inducible protein A